MNSIALSVILISISFWAKPNSTIDVVSSGQGKSIVVIAGFGGAMGWHGTVDKLSKDYRVHLITVKGVDGQKNPGRFDINRIADDILRFINSSDFEKPMLIGHSFGGFLAMKLAAEHSDQFSKLAIIDSYPFPLAMFNPAFTLDIGVQQAQVFRTQVGALPQSHYAAFWMQNAIDMVSSIEEQERFSEIILNSDRDFIIDAQCTLLATDFRGDLAKIHCPSLILASAYNYHKIGLNDETIKARVDEQFRNLPNCTTFIHQSAKHFLMLDDSDWVTEKIKQFI